MPPAVALIQAKATEATLPIYPQHCEVLSVSYHQQSAVNGAYASKGHSAMAGGSKYPPNMGTYKSMTVTWGFTTTAWCSSGDYSFFFFFPTSKSNSK
jgi:hypothetical protein